jgi:hypothetical protein
VSYAVSKDFKIELAYRYLNLGNTSTSITCFGGCNADSYKFHDLTASEFKLALRWSLYDTGLHSFAPPPQQAAYIQPQYAPAPAPVYAPQPAPVYAPPPPPAYPPQYQQPLMRKG